MPLTYHKIHKKITIQNNTAYNWTTMEQKYINETWLSHIHK